MRDPELCSPAEWAEHLRVMAAACDVSDAAWCIQPADCRELADRMDDLADALTMLGVVVRETGWTAAEELLAKYQED